MLKNTLLVKPLRNFKYAGQIGGTELVAGKAYPAERATNLPDWMAKGKIFVDGMMLETGDYYIISGAL